MNENQQDDMLSLGSASNASFNTQDVRAGLQAAADGDEWASGGMSVPGPRLRRLVEAGLGALDSPGGMVSSGPTSTVLIRGVHSPPRACTTHLTSTHLTPSHLIPSHLIPSHLTFQHQGSMGDGSSIGSMDREDNLAATERMYSQKLTGPQRTSMSRGQSRAQSRSSRSRGGEADVERGSSRGRLRSRAGTAGSSRSRSQSRSRSRSRSRSLTRTRSPVRVGTSHSMRGGTAEVVFQYGELGIQSAPPRRPSGPPLNPSPPPQTRAAT